MSLSPSAALAYGLACYRSGAAGKTLLVGWRAGQPLFAIAAGLAAGSDRDNFAILARYLLRRDQADGYWLLFSADLADQEHLVAETVTRGQRQLTAAPVQRAGSGEGMDLGAGHALGSEAPLGDLLDGGGSLPALMRRELDRLAVALALPLP